MTDQEKTTAVLLSLLIGFGVGIFAGIGITLLRPQHCLPVTVSMQPPAIAGCQSSDSTTNCVISGGDTSYVLGQPTYTYQLPCGGSLASVNQTYTKPELQAFCDELNKR